MTKIIYVDKFDADKLHIDSKSEVIILTVALFQNSNFQEALVWLKEKAIFPENKDLPFHLTGAGGVKYGEEIKAILERDVIFIEEFMAQSRGGYYLLSNVPLEELTFPEIRPDCTEKFDTPDFHNVKNQFEEIVGKIKEAKNKDDIFPCIFGFIGSGGGLNRIDSDGSFRMVGGTGVAGKTFIGLSRCILGTNDYKEITAMAARGDRRNVDTQIKDIMVRESLRNILPPDLPAFHMGKLADTKKSIKEFNKDDIAHSLVSLFMYNMINASIHVCMSEKVFNVFLGGNLYQADIFRKEFSNLKQMFGFDFLNIYFVNNGHTGALGAMMCGPDDTEKYFKI